MLESDYQAKLIKKLRVMFPGCIVLKNDSERRQGIPDLLVLHGDRWGALEVKASERSPKQANQDYYVETLNEMSFAAFIYPSIEKEVLDALRAALSVQ